MLLASLGLYHILVSGVAWFSTIPPSSPLLLTRPLFPLTLSIFPHFPHPLLLLLPLRRSPYPPLPPLLFLLPSPYLPSFGPSPLPSLFLPLSLPSVHLRPPSPSPPSLTLLHPLTPTLPLSYSPSPHPSEAVHLESALQLHLHSDATNFPSCPGWPPEDQSPRDVCSPPPPPGGPRTKTRRRGQACEKVIMLPVNFWLGDGPAFKRAEIRFFMGSFFFFFLLDEHMQELNAWVQIEGSICELTHISAQV